MYADTEAMSSSDFSHMRLQKGTTVHGSCAEPADQGKHYDQYRCRADVCGGEETIDEYLSLADQNMYRQKQMRKRKQEKYRVIID